MCPQFLTNTIICFRLVSYNPNHFGITGKCETIVAKFGSLCVWPNKLKLFSFQATETNEPHKEVGPNFGPIFINFSVLVVWLNALKEDRFWLKQECVRDDIGIVLFPYPSLSCFILLSSL